ncbi:MAG: hypothetical protein IJZ53_06900 [Tyzzerella sp.]|nr:hypothetical protein [Tyzzerella sp.]
MDKHEYRLKTEQMLQYAGKKSYKEAMDIADSIDWKKVKNTSVLCAVSEIYEANGEYEKGRDILLMAYERSSDSRKIIYRLGTLALKMDDVKEAMECYKEFVEVAPKDPNKFILKYKILRAKKASLEEQIETLEEFKKAEYVEKWAFELAKRYQEAGMISECLEECDDLILWFSEGKFIRKAMELKMQYKPLTPLQREKYENLKGFTAPKQQPATEEVAEELVAEVPVAAQPVAEAVVAEEPVAEEPAETEPVVEEPIAEEPVAAQPTVEEAADEPAVEEAKPSLSIEEMVLDWQEQQKENAQMIQAELERVEAEKAAQQEEQAEAVEESQESILPDDIRKLMEELEAESADIEAQKTRTVEEIEAETEPEEVPFGEEDNRPLLQKVVEQLAALDVKIDMPGKENEEPVQEVQVPEDEEPIFEQESFEKAMSEAIEKIDLMEESEGIKLGDTQSVALSAKALASAAKVEVPQEDVAEVVTPAVTAPEYKSVGQDTGFIVQGKYDLEAQSEIGLRAGLTEEQKKLFSYFVPVHGMSEQLVQVLQNDKKCKARYGTSRIGNILIIGRKGSGKTVLAVDLVKAIQKARKMKQGKVAIVTAASLNKKDVAEIIEKLHGGAIIIEAASKLNRRTVEDLCEAMEGQTGELLVVLEDERKPLAKLLDVYPNFAKKFTSQIELPVFINDELVTFGQTYAKENGYKIDEMGILALYSRIDMLQREEKVVTVADVKEVVDEAIENANRASVKKFMKKVLGKNKDDSERVILTEDDFK